MLTSPIGYSPIGDVNIRSWPHRMSEAIVRTLIFNQTQAGFPCHLFYIKLDLCIRLCAQMSLYGMCGHHQWRIPRLCCNLDFAGAFQIIDPVYSFRHSTSHDDQAMIAQDQRLVHPKVTRQRRALFT